MYLEIETSDKAIICRLFEEQIEKTELSNISLRKKDEQTYRMVVARPEEPEPEYPIT
jgi:hypothetical protein